MNPSYAGRSAKSLLGVRDVAYHIAFPISVIETYISTTTVIIKATAFQSLLFIDYHDNLFRLTSSMEHNAYPV